MGVRSGRLNRKLTVGIEIGRNSLECSFNTFLQSLKINFVAFLPPFNGCEYIYFVLVVPLAVIQASVICTASSEMDLIPTWSNMKTLGFRQRISP